jgi:hypothetical protein
MKSFLTWAFGNPEEINGHGRCPTYLFRWTLFAVHGWKVYVHRFVGDDWSRDFHDHPKRFWTVGFWGKYLEYTPRGQRWYRAPWIRTFPAEHKHRITTPHRRTCWTLVIVSPTVRAWGFWHNERFIDWRTYVGSALADAMKDCP